jgi:signal transduction histidine kinase/ActR/RegA family two-component response regulator
MNRAEASGSRFLRDLPIRQKLMAVVLLTTTAALLVAGIGLVAADFFLFRGYLERDLSTLARIVGDNSTASLEFNEPQSAKETLAALRERPHIVMACIYQTDGTVLASYSRSGSDTKCPAPTPGRGVRWSRDVTISQPILLKGVEIGTLVIRYDLGEISERLWFYGTTVFGVLLASSLVAFLLSSKLRETIATPISQLAQATKSVAATKDYSIRAERYSADELGLLVDAFNEMLSGIQSRDTNLIKALTEREDALGEARGTRDFLRTTLASIADAVISTDASARIVFANPVALALLRRTEAETIGKPVDEVFRTVEEGDWTFLLTANQKRIPIEHTEAPIVTAGSGVGGAVLVFRDITERERLAQEKVATEEQLRQSAKLESLGVLAGGIAHDFNNLLVGIMGNASLAADLLPPSDKAVPLIQDVVDASERAAQLTRQMLAYSGRGRFIIDLVDLSQEVEEILPLISRPIPRSVSVHLNLEPNLPAIEADKSQLQQILMNLVINAAEACGSHPGSVFIKTCREKKDQSTSPPAFGLAPIEPGIYVCLSIKDTGSGMSDEVKAKIFDPFFTTKFTGRGLGLSAVLGIIRSHKGTIEVESAPDMGTTFRVFFPAVSGVVEAEKKHPVARREPRGTGTVLVVDDEEIVRNTARSALELSGYQVILAEDGEAGVQKFGQFADQVSMVILDLTMPVMDGESALAQMKKLDPAVKVVLSSGFDRLEIAERFKGKGLAGFLQKPYTTAKLLQIVGTAMVDGGGS